MTLLKEVAGEKETLREAPECGIKEYNSKEDILCGVKSYNRARGKVCGVERFNAARSKLLFQNGILAIKILSLLVMIL